MGSSTHIIGRQTIRMHYNGSRDPFELQQIVSSVCSDELPVRLNKLLDRYDDKDFEIRIDKLHIDLSLTEEGDLHVALAKAITEKVEAALLQKLEHKGTEQPLSIVRRFTNTLLNYLERGYLQRYSIARDVATFRQAVNEHWSQTLLLRGVVPEILLVLQSTNARSRIAELLDWRQVEAFALATEYWTETTWKEWQVAFLFFKQQAKGHGITSVDEIIRRAIIDTISLNPDKSKAVIALAHSIVNTFPESDIIFQELKSKPTLTIPVRTAFLKALKSEKGELTIPQTENLVRKPLQPAEIKPARPKDPTSEAVPAEEESIFVQSSGLVLIALYLPAFFANIGLLGADGKPTDTARAIAILRYLVYETGSFTELEVVMEKLLCGIPLSQGISQRHVISDVEREQAEELLSSVIQHWTVLKNTTSAGLRHSFLQREGKLSFRNNQWQLTVQKQPHDILLDYLPWNIGLIKLQWMPHMLTVKWNS